MTSDIDRIMMAYDGDAPGASVLVVRDGETLVQRTYGYADLNRRVRTTPQTNYRLASITKQFTAAAILLLRDDGVLELDDSVRRWLPSLPLVTNDITIRHLLTHTSGLVDYEDLIAEGTTEQVHDADVLALLEKEPESYFAPGTSYRYSNSGYALLALIVETASRMSFAEFLQQRIFTPLGMDGSVAFEEGVSAVGDRAYGHSRTGDTWTLDDQSVTSAVLGDGGIYSSVVDLVKWDAALNDDRLLTPASLREAFTPATPTDRPGVSYGFGWRIEPKRMWHTGETRGFRNALVRFPEERLTVAVLTNRNEGKPYELALEIAEMFR